MNDLSLEEAAVRWQSERSGSSGVGQRLRHRLGKSWKWLQRCWLDMKTSQRQQRRLASRIERYHFLLLLLLLALFCYMFWRSSSTGHSSLPSNTASHLRFVSMKEARHEVHQRSHEVSCAQIEGREELPGYDSLRLPAVVSAASSLLKQRDMHCNCAPLYDVSYRYITLRDSGTLLHLFNPAVTGSLPELGRSLVQESQELLLPGAGVREVTRLNGILLTYLDASCRPHHSVAFTQQSAWCIQSCIDLLNGKTIYDTPGETVHAVP